MAWSVMACGSVMNSDAFESRAAVASSSLTPEPITDQAATMGEFVTNVGNVEQPVATQNLFAFDPYDAIRE